MPVSRFALLILLVALVFPRVAWGAHEAGHDRPADVTAEHVHHGDHSHDVAALQLDDHAPIDGIDADKLAHDHLPADILSAMADGSSAFELASVHDFASLRVPVRHRAAPPSSLPDSLLRPPRTA